MFLVSVKVNKILSAGLIVIVAAEVKALTFSIELANLLLTYAVVAIWVLLVVVSAVGAVGVPVNAGDALGAYSS